LHDILKQPNKHDGGIDDLRAMIKRTRSKLDKQIGVINNFTAQVRDIRNSNLGSDGPSGTMPALTNGSKKQPALKNGHTALTARRNHSLANSCFHRPVDLVPLQDRRVGPRKSFDSSSGVSGIVSTLAKSSSKSSSFSSMGSTSSTGGRSRRFSKSY
jgi:hypothetical protein